MNGEISEKLKNIPRIKLLILIFAIWQYISILGMALLGWPNSLVWLNLGLLTAFIVLAPVYESLLLLVLSAPFFVVLPNTAFETLSMWRPLFVVLFLVWLIRDKKFRYENILFLPWDKILAAFVVVGLSVSLLWGQFVVQGFKQVLFWANVYLFYLVLINSLKSRQQIFEFIRYVIWALAIIITLGFTQLIGTFLANLDTFWVFWASNITKLYYGQAFATVSLYSNSWFSYMDGRSLRMFSIMPDSQSFAYLCLFALCMATALTHNVFRYVKKWLWSGVRFAGLALILSGTRAVWVGMLLPFGAVVLAHYKNFQKHLANKFILPFVIIFALFLISPAINRTLSFFRVEVFQENFLGRVRSIYDLKDVSNSGRIKIWHESFVFALKHPLGVGFGNFIVSLKDPSGRAYEDVAGEINQRYNLPQRYVSAHNLYLQILVEAGILGLVVFLGFWFVLLKYLWHFIKHYRKAEDFLVYFVAQAFLASLWVLGAAFFDITIFNDKVLFFFLIDIGLAGLIVKKYHEYELEV